MNPLSAFLPLGVRRALWSVTAIAVFLIVMPTAYLFLWSIYGTEVVGRLRPLTDPNLRWFADVFGAPEWQNALAISIGLALLASTLGTIAMALYDYCIRFSRPFIRIATWIAMVLLLTNPLVTYGVSLRALAAHSSTSVWIIILIGHLAVLAPLQFLVFEAGRASVETGTLEAARTLGASHGTTFLTVYVPAAFRAIFASVVIGAFVSFDELVIALFTLEGAETTVPLQIWRSISQVVEPQPAVVSVVVVFAASAAWLVYDQLKIRPVPNARGAFERLRGLWKELLGALGGVALVRAASHEGSGPWHVLQEVVLHTAGALAGALVVSLVKLRRVLRRLIMSVNVERPGARAVGRRFVLPSVDEEAGALEGLLGGGWVPMNQGQMQRLTNAFFAEFGAGRYIGTDRHVPSEYFALFPDYLEAQLRDRRGRGDVRVVLYGKERLLADLRQTGSEGGRFLETHWACGVQLLCVEWSLAREAARRVGLETPDLALFVGHAVLFFRPPEEDFPSSHVLWRPLDAVLSSRIDLFFRAVLPVSEEIVRSADQPFAVRGLDRSYVEVILERIGGAK